MSNLIIHNHSNDGIDRRGFLNCMAWAGTGVLWTISGGVPSSSLFGQIPPEEKSKGDLTFVQISDSHIGFAKPANPDVTGTLQVAIDRINALPVQPEMILHTGDLTHSAKPSEFDVLAQSLQSCRQKQIFYVPGEHDFSVDDGKGYLERFGKGTQGKGWYSFHQKGVHFIGLVNSAVLEGMGMLGAAQLEWLKNDLKGLSRSTPIVVFAHIPLWSVYPEWGWGTGDSAMALTLLKPFGSVTVLNGHIHQVLQKVEGNVAFHSAMSTAFPQPAPGKAPSPGPMKVAAEDLKGVLGFTNVQHVSGKHALAVVDTALAA